MTTTQAKEQEQEQKQEQAIEFPEMMEETSPAGKIIPIDNSGAAAVADAGDLSPINEADVDVDGDDHGSSDGKTTAVADPDQQEHTLQHRIEEMELLALKCSIDPAGWLEKQKSQNSITGIIFYYGDWCK
jgi:hypothetical protein